MISLSKVLKSSVLKWGGTATQPIPVGLLPEAIEEIAATVSPALLEEELTAKIAEATMIAERTLLETRAKADEILQAARIEADVIRAEAQKLGHDDGYRDGQRRAAAEFEQRQTEEHQRMSDLAQSLEAQRVEQLSQMKPVLLQLAIESVRRVLQRELQLASPDISNIVQELLQYVIQGTSVQVRVHPDDFQQARVAQPKWQLAKFGDWVISVVPDATLAPGDCEIHADTGWVDGKIRTRLAELERALIDASDEVDQHVQA